MTQINKEKKVGVHSWDWKEQPNWKKVLEIIEFIQKFTDSGVIIHEIETGTDEYAIVVGERWLTQEEANKLYQERYDWE